jgi:hypothetical protein
MPFNKLDSLNFITKIMPKNGKIKLTQAGLKPVEEIVKAYDHVMLELIIRTPEEKPNNIERYMRYLTEHVLKVISDGLIHEGYLIYNIEQVLGIMLRQYCETIVRSRHGGSVFYFTDMSCLQDEVLLRKFISNCMSFGERNFKLKFKSIDEFENHKQ